MLLSWSPCGRAVDMLRFGYRALMRTYFDSAPVPVVWFRVPDHTPEVPYPTLYGSRNWSDPHFNDGMGEQNAGKICCGKEDIDYYLGYPPAPYTGRGDCGGKDVAYRGGVLGVDPPLTLLPNGFPTCCKPPSMVWDGGSAEGGDWLMTPRLRAWQGGEAEGGLWSASNPLYVTWTGGEAEGGNWPRGDQVVVSWTGGEAEGGNWPRGDQVVVSWTGGEAEGGNWPRASQLVFQAHGGQGEGGFGGFPVVNQFAQGGQGEGGFGAQGNQVLQQAAAGGQGEGGFATFHISTITQAAIGGQGEGGTALQGAPTFQVSQGGQGEGGAAVFVRVTQTSVGGQGEGGEARFVGVNQFAIGGQGEGGVAQQAIRPNQVAEGGQGEGGVAQQGMLFVNQFAIGGQGEGGFASFTFINQHAEGGQGEGGFGGFPVVNQFAIGGQGEGGTGFQGQTVLTQAAIGGQGEGGEAVQGQPPQLVAVTSTDGATGAFLVAVPAGGKPGDLYVAVVGTANFNALPVTSPDFTQWQQVGSVVGTVQAQSFYRRHTGTEGAFFRFTCPAGMSATATIALFSPGAPVIKLEQAGASTSPVAAATIPGNPTTSPINLGVWFWVAAFLTNFSVPPGHTLIRTVTGSAPAILLTYTGNPLPNPTSPATSTLGPASYFAGLFNEVGG